MIEHETNLTTGQAAKTEQQKIQEAQRVPHFYSYIRISDLEAIVSWRSKYFSRVPTDMNF